MREVKENGKDSNNEFNDTKYLEFLIAENKNRVKALQREIKGLKDKINSQKGAENEKVYIFNSLYNSTIFNILLFDY